MCYVLSARVLLASLHSTPLVFSLYFQGGKPRLIDQTPPHLLHAASPRSLDLANPSLAEIPTPVQHSSTPIQSPTHFEFSLLDVERMVQVVLMDMKCGGVEEAGGGTGMRRRWG